MQDIVERNNIIKCYFHLGLTNKEILAFLAHKHHIIISISTLKRITKRLCLFRRNREEDLVHVALFIVRQCEEAGQLNGYRWMHSKCIAEGYVVSQATVRLLLSIIDPEGVELRTKRRLRRRRYESPGPNFVWHMDGLV